MKIVYATDTYWPRINGVTVSISSYKEQMEKRGHEVHVLSPMYPGRVNIRDKEKNIHRFSSYKILFTSHDEDRLVYPWNKGEAFRVLDSIKPDIIHQQTEFSMGIMAFKYAKTHDVPVVLTSHTYFEEYAKLYFPFIPEFLLRAYVRNRAYRFYNKVDFMITPTIRMKDVIKSYKVTTPIEVIPTGLSGDDFNGIDKKRDKSNSIFANQYPQIKGKKILLYTGRIGGEKNIYFLFNVMMKLIPKHKDLMFLLAGDGPQRRELEGFVKAKGIDKNVLFLGYVDRGVIKYLYSLADIFIFASKTESQGLVTIEAMMCHTPVVALGIMGTKDVMNGDNGGYMVDENIDQFAEKVDHLLSDKKLYKKKSDEAYKYSQNWTLDKTAKKMEEVYRAIIALRK